MKFKKTAGKMKITLSHKEWQAIGKKAGWIKRAETGDVLDELMVCDDCFMLIANGDDSGLTAEEAQICDKGIRATQEQYNGYLVPGDDADELSTRPCECCNRNLAGRRNQVIILSY